MIKKDKHMSNKEYISKLAQTLADNGTTMSGEELAQHLNRNNMKTSYGTEYAGKRGIYKLIQDTYKWLESQGLHQEARNVAVAFVKPDGSYAYQ